MVKIYFLNEIRNKKSEEYKFKYLVRVPDKNNNDLIFYLESFCEKNKINLEIILESEKNKIYQVKDNILDEEVFRNLFQRYLNFNQKNNNYLIQFNKDNRRYLILSNYSYFNNK
jgi:hypothetical protein